MPPQITCASAVPGKTGNTKNAFLANVNSCLRSLYAIARPSDVCPSVACRL